MPSAADTPSIYAASEANPPLTLASLLATLPGIVLLFAIGLLVKLLVGGATFLRTHYHFHLPQIEYVTYWKPSCLAC